MTQPTVTYTSAAEPATIATPDRRLRVFVSSTLQELAAERQAVRRAITSAHLTPIMFELGARPHPPRDLYRAYLAQSDVFVGIYAASYGWVAPGEEVSGLEDEYLLSGDRPKLIYVKASAERQPRLQELLKRVQRDDRAAYKRFETADELAELLADDLAVLLTERFASTRPSVQGLRPGRLPVAPTPIVGREPEVRRLVELLRDAEVRLVTLVGSGGIGKTRVALEAVTQLQAAGGEAARDGIWFVDLTPIREPGLVVEAVAAAFGVRAEGTSALLDVVIDRLMSHHVVLVLDNFEQVVGAAADVARLVASCPSLTVVVTSRTVLGLRGEYPLALPPLPTPGEVTGDGAADPAAYASVALFVARARQVRPGFTLTATNAPVVAELCRRLDGIPLAIELAAAQLRVLTPAALLRRLRDRLDRSLDLDTDAVDAPSRQRTLRDTIGWSYSLLGPAERTLLARLSVFAHTWTLEAAEEVGTARTDGTADLDVVDTLSSLVAQSLLTVDESDPDELRFGMLGSVRSFAQARLADDGDQAATLTRLTAWLQRFAAAAGEGLADQDNRRWADLVEAQLEDLRAALQRCLQADDAESLVRIAAPLFTFWWSRGRLAEMRTLAEQAAALPSAARLHTDAANSLLWARGMFRITNGQLRDAEPLLERLRTLTQADGDGRLRAFALAGLGMSRMDVPLAERRALLADAADGLRALGDRWGLAFALSIAGQLALQADDAAAATRLHCEALTITREIDSEFLQAQLLDLLGLDAMAQGDLAEARGRFVDAATVHRRLTDVEGSANCLDGFASVALGQGRPEVAARLLGASARGRRVIGVTVWPALQPAALALAEAVRSALGPGAYEQGRAWGDALSTNQALDYAVEATEMAPTVGDGNAS